MTVDSTVERRRAQRKAIQLIVGVLAGSVAYRVLAWQHLEHTSLVFIGIPAILAIATVLTPAPATVTGAILKVITIALLLSGVIFGEAFVCILFASPLFYLVGLAIGQFADWRQRHRDRGLHLHSILLIGVVIAPASLEGVLPGFAFNREERVSVTRVIGAAPDEVAATLAARPRFTRPLPPFLRLGFPTPGGTAGAGLQPGDERRIEFLHGHHPGVLVLRVSRSAPGVVEFEMVSDDSYITHWLTWRHAEVRWREVSSGRTEVSWTLGYRRRLDPAWYFSPLERFGVATAAGYLLDTVTTPVRVDPSS